MNLNVHLNNIADALGNNLQYIKTNLNSKINVGEDAELKNILCDDITLTQLINIPVLGTDENGKIIQGSGSGVGYWNFNNNNIFNTNSGNVGIGINNPLSKLHIDNNSYNSLQIDSNNDTKLLIDIDGNLNTKGSLTSNTLTSNNILFSDSNKKITSSNINVNLLNYLIGVDSNIQNQIDSKQDTITGGASTIIDNNLISDRILISNGSGKVATSNTNSIQLSYLNNVSSDIQNQLNNKLNKLTGLDEGKLLTVNETEDIISSNLDTVTLGYVDISSSLTELLNDKQDVITGGATSIIDDNLEINRVLISDGIGKVNTSNITTTKLNYLNDVSSNIQEQINSKVSKNGDTMIGNLSIINSEPSISISNDTNQLGTIYLGNTSNYISHDINDNIIVKSDNTLQFSTGDNEEHMRISLDGNVGIGTTNPTTKLDVIGSVNITGDLYVSGTETILNTETLNVEDNMITVNSNMVGTPPPEFQGGIKVNRGDESEYLFIFDEASKFFKIGEGQNGLQAVATRNDIMNNNSIPYWNNVDKKFVDSSISKTELEYLSGATSNIQNQINYKQDVITNLTENNLLTANETGVIISSNLNTTTLGYVDIGSSLTGLLGTKQNVIEELENTTLTNLLETKQDVIEELENTTLTDLMATKQDVIEELTPNNLLTANETGVIVSSNLNTTTLGYVDIDNPLSGLLDDKQDVIEELENTTLTNLLNDKQNVITELENTTLTDLMATKQDVITDLTPNNLLTTTQNGDIVSSSLNTTTLGYVDITSSLTGLLNDKQDVITELENTTLTDLMATKQDKINNLTENNLLTVDETGAIVSSALNTTTLGYVDIGRSLSGLLDDKQDVITELTPNNLLTANETGVIISSNLNTTTLGYVDISSSLSGLLDNKQDVITELENTTLTDLLNDKQDKINNLTLNNLLTADETGDIVSSALNTTTLGYVDIGSSLTGLLNDKQNIITELTPNNLLTATQSGDIVSSTLNTTTLGYVDISNSLSGLLNDKQDVITELENTTLTDLMAIKQDKINNLTENNLLTATQSGDIVSSTLNTTTLGYVDISSSLSGLLDDKQDVITGAATTIVNDNLEINRVLISDQSGKVDVSNITTTELEYLTNINSNIQDQINSKVSKNGDIMSGNLSIINNTNPSITISNDTNQLGAIYLGNNDNYISHDINDNIIIKSDNTLQFLTGITGEQMRINEDGNIGIGTTNPVTKLDVIGNVNITGDLYVSGTETILNTETLNVEDNMITVNSNMSGIPPPEFQGGIKVNRGDETEYLFIFDEASKFFKIGEGQNGLQAVATRDDILSDNDIPKWNASDIKLVSSGISSNNLTGLTGNVQTQLDSKLNKSGDTMSGQLTLVSQKAILNLQAMSNNTSTGGNYINIMDNNFLRFGSNDANKTHILVTGDSFSSGNGTIALRASQRINFETIEGSGSEDRLTRMTIRAGTGNIGLGVTNPLEKLHVNGNIRSDNLTENTVLISDTNKNIISSTVTTTELEALSGVNGNIQTQLDSLDDSSITTLNIIDDTNIDSNTKLTRFIHDLEISSLGSGVNNYVNTITSIGDDLYIGGNFITFDGVTVNRIVKYNTITKTITPFGIGANGEVNIIFALGNDLYVGGRFTSIDGNSLSAIGRYNINDNTWYPLGTGFGPDGTTQPYLNWITEHGGILYMCGRWGSAGGMTMYNLAAYNTETEQWVLWSSANNQTTVSLVVGSYIYVGGSVFTSVASSIVIQNIARYNINTQTWSNLNGGGVSNNIGNASIYSMKLIGTDLYIGGTFEFAGGISSISLAIYDTVADTWKPTIITNIDFPRRINTINLFRNDIYVGGNFTNLNGIQYLAKYNTTTETWSNFISINSQVNILYVVNDTMYIGGYFTVVANQTVNRLCKYPSDPIFIYSNDGETEYYKLQSYNDNVLVSQGNIVSSDYLSSAQFDTNKVIVSDGDRNLITSDISTTTLGYLDATSSVQDQINNRVEKSGVSSMSGTYNLTNTAKLSHAGFTANRVLLSDVNKNIVSSDISNTTLEYLDATSSIQTQLNRRSQVYTSNSGIATRITNPIICRGTALTASDGLATVNFGLTYSVAPIVVATAQHGTGNPVIVVVQSITTTQFTIKASATTGTPWSTIVYWTSTG